MIAKKPFLNHLNYETLHLLFFSILIWLPHSSVQIFSSPPSLSHSQFMLFP